MITTIRVFVNDTILQMRNSISNIAHTDIKDLVNRYTKPDDSNEKK